MQSNLVLTPVEDLLRLRSTEGFLVCSGCRAWTADCPCPDPRASLGLVAVSEILLLKNGHRLESCLDGYRTAADMPALEVEGDILLDGHNRLRAALMLGLPALFTFPGSGIAQAQETYHRALFTQRRASAFAP